VITQSCTAVTMTLTFILLVTGQARVEYLLLLGALSSSFRAFDEPSRMALLPQLTPRDQLPNAIALGTIPWPAGRVVAPSIAGLMIAAFGAPIGFAFATAASLAALGLYSRISVPATTPPADGPGLLGQLIEGLDFVRRNFLFASIISLALFHSLFGLSYITLLPIYADLYFEAGSSGYGLLQAAHGLGAVVSTLVIASVTHRLRRRGLAALLFGTVFGLLLAALSLSATLPIAMFVLICMGLTNTFFLMQLNTILQEQVPDALRGRVMSLFSLGYNLVPIGGLISGGLAAAVDARFALLVSGFLVAAASFLTLVTSRRLRAVP
jgi:MFS family permease